MNEVIRKPQDYEWGRERLDPIYKELDQLRPVLGRSLESKVSLLCAYLANVQANGFYVNNENASAAEVARTSITQKEVAEKALKLANSIRRKWGDV